MNTLRQTTVWLRPNKLCFTLVTHPCGVGCVGCSTSLGAHSTSGAGWRQHTMNQRARQRARGPARHFCKQVLPGPVGQTTVEMFGSAAAMTSLNNQHMYVGLSVLPTSQTASTSAGAASQPAGKAMGAQPTAMLQTNVYTGMSAVHASCAHMSNSKLLAIVKEHRC
jgi:hypothetical protein